jgi:hypothetical protein
MIQRITPKPGAPIRDPVTLERLPAEGILVDRISAHWMRRAAEGGVTITDEPSAPAPAAAPSRTPTAPTVPAKE